MAKPIIPTHLTQLDAWVNSLNTAQFEALDDATRMGFLRDSIAAVPSVPQELRHTQNDTKKATGWMLRAIARKIYGPMWHDPKGNPVHKLVSEAYWVKGVKNQPAPKPAKPATPKAPTPSKDARQAGILGQLAKLFPNVSFSTTDAPAPAAPAKPVDAAIQAAGLRTNHVGTPFCPVEGCGVLRAKDLTKPCTNGHYIGQATATPAPATTTATMPSLPTEKADDFVAQLQALLNQPTPAAPAAPALPDIAVQVPTTNVVKIAASVASANPDVVVKLIAAGQQVEIV